MEMDYRRIEALLVRRDGGWWQAVAERVPEVAALAGTPQPQRHHGEGDAAVHTRMTVDACPPGAGPDLLWAALFHDIGKPVTTMISGSRITARDHHNVGADMAEDVLKRLGMPPKRIACIAWVIRNHLFYHFWQVTRCRDLTPRHWRYIRDLRFPLLLELVQADALAKSDSAKGLAAAVFYNRCLCIPEKSST